MNLISDSRYQRDTDTLNQQQTKHQIEKLFNISQAIQQCELDQSLKYIEDFKLFNQNIKKNIQQDSPILIQVKFQQILLKISKAMPQKSFLTTIKKLYLQLVDLLRIVQNLSQEYQKLQKQRWQEGEDFYIKIATAILQLSIKCNQIVPDEWLQNLIIKLKLYPQRLRQVIGKFTGCKDLVNFSQNFNLQVITRSSQNKAQVAQKLDILTTWLLFAGKNLQGLQCKQTAVQLWKNSNSLKQYNKCTEQLQDLKGKKTKIDYMKKIKSIRKIVKQIIKQVPLVKQNNKDMHLILSKSFALAIKNLQFQEIDQPKKSNIKQSSLKLSTNSKLKFDAYQNRCSQFCSDVYSKEKGNEITDLLLKSKFIFKQEKMFRITITPFSRLVNVRYRYFFDIVHLNYQIKGSLDDSSKVIVKKKSNLEYQDLKLIKVQSDANASKQLKQSKIPKQQKKKSGNKLIQKGLQQASQDNQDQEAMKKTAELFKMFKKSSNS